MAELGEESLRATGPVPCQSWPTFVFFGPELGEPAADRIEREELAKSVCSGCPQKHECYWGAIQRREPAGVWGGSTFPDAWKRGYRRLREQVRGLDEPGDDDVSELRSA